MKTQITLILTPAQAAGLRAQCAAYGVSPEVLLQRFISDLTGALGNGGSDEREFAGNWADRSLHFGCPPRTGRGMNRLWRMQSAAHAAIKSESRAAQVGGVR